MDEGAFQDAKLSKTLIVYTNGSDEIFVTNRKSGVVMRISDQDKDILVTSSGFIMTPTAKNGLPAIRIQKR